MKKIMFNDKYRLTQAVFEGRKTQTRRIIPKDFFSLTWDKRDDTLVYENSMGDFIDVRNSRYALYKAGEVVTIAQSYCSIADELNDLDNATCVEHYEQNVEKASEYMLLIEHPGFYNKMFVAPDMMIHQILITNVRVERLQDISDEDCLKEGIYEDSGDDEFPPSIFYEFEGNKDNGFDTPREAFAALIDKVSGKGTWERNPYVFVYDFELVK